MKIKEIFPAERIYFMADLHYDHINIMKHDPRNFEDVSEMNEYIRNVLSQIEPYDVVFDLGDTFWKTPTSEITDVFSLIPKTARVYKVIGNHDAYGLFYGEASMWRTWYKGCADILDINVENNGRTEQITMSHYPMVSWNHKPHGSLHLHGHCHGNIDVFNNSSPDLRFDVGYNSEIAKNYGSFLIPFSEVYKEALKKTNGEADFRKYVLTKCSEL